MTLARLLVLVELLLIQLAALVGVGLLEYLEHRLRRSERPHERTTRDVGCWAEIRESEVAQECSSR